MSAKKATIYLDAEDDITAVIEHVKKSKEQIIALVIPKRAEVFNSLVNMKLLKQASKTAKKQTVLITDNPNITKIAGAVGVYVASSLRSKPVIPAPPIKQVDGTKPVGDLEAEASKVSDEPKLKSDVNESTATSAAAASASKKAAKSKKDKRIKVPNFDAFRVKLAVAIVAILLLPVLWFVAFRVLPTATIKISTNATNLPATVEAVSTNNLDGLDVENGILPITTEENKQQYAENYEATGEKQVGDKASGLMTISNCKEDNTEANIPAGTVFSSGNLEFVSAVAVNLAEGEFNSPGSGGDCRSTGDHVKTITVTAVKPGDQYNLSSRSYNINGIDNEVTAFGGDMSGGSNEVVTVVSQQDIDSAVQRLNAKKDESAVRSQLENALRTAGFVPVSDSFRVTETDPVASAPVDEEATSGTVTVNATYTMAGVRETDVLEFVMPELEELAGDLQVIESGIAGARYSAVPNANGGFTVEIQTTGIAGVVLKEDEVFESIKGQKADEAASGLRAREGITGVEVSTSPFWNSSIPNNRDKVTIEINGNQ